MRESKQEEWDAAHITSYVQSVQDDIPSSASLMTMLVHYNFVLLSYDYQICRPHYYEPLHPESLAPEIETADFDIATFVFVIQTLPVVASCLLTCLNCSTLDMHSKL